MSEEPDPLYHQIYNRLQEKDKEELSEIWKKNNRGEWSDTAFSIIHEILLKRLGSEPPPQEGPFDEETEQETFLDIDKISSLSAIANAIAWVILTGYAIAWVANLLLGFSGSISLSQIFALLPPFASRAIFVRSAPFCIRGPILAVGDRREHPAVIGWPLSSIRYYHNETVQKPRIWMNRP